jgi:glycerophosphoryl diester phosphodiesterase
VAQLSPAAKKFFDSPVSIAIAHRGGDGASFSKRNTMAAFQSAYNLGYKYMETDVALAKNGQVVITHNAPVGQEPRLLDVLQTFPTIKFFIDPKTDEVVEPLVDIIKKTKSLQRVCIGSFSYKRLKKVAELLGGWDKACTSYISQAIWRQFRPNFEGDALCVPHWSITSVSVRQARKYDLKLIAWTPNGYRSINRLIDLGVDGIISDRVELLKELLDSGRKI